MSTDISEILTGVKNGKQEDYDKLRRKYSPLISKEVFSFNMSGAGSESELRDEAERALLSAAVSFDETLGVGFGYYAKVCIRNALITLRRAVISREKKLEKMNAIPSERRKRSFEAFEGMNQDEIMEKISAVLSPYEKKVFIMSLEGKSAGEIAAIVKKDEKSVNNAIFRSRSKIRKMNET
ncbi:MAG: sigma-70 family RNA polymerase sigma factor [Clostridia bacterium]|nr:sigma-70 family RNA polymerase sigma factor [Clostridia bacterium]